MLGHHEKTEQIAFTGRPSQLWDETNPDWAPTLLLGYSARHEDRARYDRVKRRRLQKDRADAAAAVVESIGNGIGDTGLPSRDDESDETRTDENEPGQPPREDESRMDKNEPGL
ncbi:hypothetical protein HPB52_013075 [Rhipicephalus sanguineus]|uniref:Uncharacterized protein n=1 Tax=Rhipicephalus sanguineus TaxID=34632 RepID=A0A9D4Q6P2_RHISA|nr:hypothetical protein HPB52_013075 [Rhipicephalus sanguineus]